MKTDLSLHFHALHYKYVGTYKPKLQPRDNWKSELIDWTARVIAPDQLKRRVTEIQDSMEPLEQLSRRWLSVLDQADMACSKLKADGAAAFYRLHKFFPTGRKRSDEEWAGFAFAA